jgi:glycerol kinase
MKKYIMSIDQGTTGSNVVIMDQGGSLVAASDRDFLQIFPQPGWVEHNPTDIWNSIESSAQEALKKAGVSAADIFTIGITNQRETVIAWRKSTSQVLHNAIVWQCRRTSDMCKKLKPKWSKIIKDKTGLVLDPYFSGTKMRWLVENVPEVSAALKENDLAFGTIDTFILWKLTQGKSYFTDVSNASRTMVMNLKSLDWDDQLLKLFKINRSCLPEIKSSADDFGTVYNCKFASNQTTVNGIAGDQQSALFGQTCFSAGDSKCTFGTGSFILMNTGNKVVKSKFGLLSTVAWKIKNEMVTYALEGGAFVCGAAVGWLRDGLGIIENSSEVEKLAAQVDNADGVEFVPALTGLGAPYWCPEARGEITGLTRGTTKAHIARATLEAMALQNADILRAMQKDLKKKMKFLRVDGGASANNLLMQIQSDYLQTEVVRPVMIETTAAGAAYLAGIGSGLWTMKDLQKISKVDRNFKVKMSLKDLNKRLISWNKAIKKVRI